MNIGTRNTQIKKQILETFENAKYPITALEIIAKVNANKTTIYRELLVFRLSGIIKEVDFGEGKKRYELSAHGHHHHLICQKCNKVDDITVDENYLLKKVEKQSSFKIQNHSLEFFGLCQSCQ